MKKLSPLIATIVLLLSLASPALARDLFVDSGQIFPDNLFYAEHVALADLDGDGDLDVFVANDSEPNRVWLNTSRSPGGSLPAVIFLLEE